MISKKIKQSELGLSLVEVLVALGIISMLGASMGEIIRLALQTEKRVQAWQTEQDQLTTLAVSLKSLLLFDKTSDFEILPSSDKIELKGISKFHQASGLKIDGLVLSFDGATLVLDIHSNANREQIALGTFDELTLDYLLKIPEPVWMQSPPAQADLLAFRLTVHQGNRSYPIVYPL